MLKTNRIDVIKFLDAKKEAEKNETEEGFSFQTVDLTDDLRYK